MVLPIKTEIYNRKTFKNQRQYSAYKIEVDFIFLI